MQKKTGFKVLILGGGRWGQVTYNNLESLNTITDLHIISRSLNQKNSILNKGVEIKRNLIIKKAIKYDLIIICKNNITKNNFFRKVSSFKNFIVIEKPLIIKKNIKIFLKLFYKKNFYISLPWYFENKLNKIINDINIKYDINRINFIWYDSPKIKYGLKKNFDKDIYFSEDIFSHIFSILNNDTFDVKKLIFNSFTVQNNIEYLNFSNENLEINLKSSNKNNKSIKKITFYTNQNKIFEIDIYRKYFLIKNLLSKSRKRIIRNFNNLLLQYEHILTRKNLYEFKKFCYYQILYQHQLSRLCKKYRP